MPISAVVSVFENVDDFFVECRSLLKDIINIYIDELNLMSGRPMRFDSIELNEITEDGMEVGHMVLSVIDNDSKVVVGSIAKLIRHYVIQDNDTRLVRVMFLPTVLPGTHSDDFIPKLQSLFGEADAIGFEHTVEHYDFTNIQLEELANADIDIDKDKIEIEIAKKVTELIKDKTKLKGKTRKAKS